MKTVLFSLCLISWAAVFAQGAALGLPKDCQEILDKRFRGWKLADVDPAISEYFRRERSFEQPNLIKGDFDGDGRTDYAVLLQNKNDAGKRITVVLMRHKSGYQTRILEANDCLMAIKKGKKGYDFETRKSFRYQTDAVFSYIWEKAGVSYVWERGNFRAIATSD